MLNAEMDSWIILFCAVKSHFGVTNKTLNTLNYIFFIVKIFQSAHYFSYVNLRLAYSWLQINGHSNVEYISSETFWFSHTRNHYCVGNPGLGNFRNFVINQSVAIDFRLSQWMDNNWARIYIQSHWEDGIFSSTFWSQTERIDNKINRNWLS